MREELERDAERFHQEATREYYLVRSGQKEALELSPIYERYEHLFTRAAAQETLRERRERGGRFLAEFITLEHLENSVKQLSDQIANMLLRAKATWEGQEVAYHNLEILYTNEPHLDRRHHLYQNRMQITAQANPLRGERWVALQAAAKELGFPHYGALCDELRALDLARLAKEMKTLLAETERAYFERLGYYLYRIDVPEAQANRADIAFLFRAAHFDPLFPSQRLISSLTATLQGLGIRLAEQKNLELDIEPRPLKSPRAFVAPIRIPEEVKLVIKPRGGQDDYDSFYHEAGHAQHFVHVSPELVFPFRRLGDNSITECYAFLFQHLLHSPRWLEVFLGVEGAQDYLRHVHFRKLYMLRRYASKLLYELDLHADGLFGAEQRYAALLGNNLGLSIYPEDYLDDLDDAFYAAQYLRAWILEMQLRRYLEDHFGRDWFAHPEAGRFLIGLWQRGQEFTAPELAVDLGYAGLSLDPLLEELTRR
ncbi:MAG: hypothetical protein HYZ68_00055 [Chloroflexi bacterium]|nr:hypothetical protein [Chloroflexota bacterium]